MTKKHYHCLSSTQLVKKFIIVELPKKSKILPDYKPLDPSGLKFEEPSITDKIDMVVNESIPVAEVAELNRLKPEIESYRAELNK